MPGPKSRTMTRISGAPSPVVTGLRDTITLPPEAPYLSAFSIRFSNRRSNSSRSPAMVTGLSGRLMSTTTWRSRARGSSPSATWRMIGTRSTEVSGRTWADSSTRDSDNRSSIRRARIVLGRALQRVDEAGQGGERRAQLVAGIGDEIGAHFLDPAQRRLVVEGHQHAFLGAAEGSRRGNRRDHQFHPAVDRHVIEIGGAARLGGSDGLAQCSDDFGR